MEVLTNVQGNVLAVLRITDGKGYLAYLWMDSNDTPAWYEIEQHMVTFENWAAECCELEGARLTEY